MLHLLGSAILYSLPASTSSALVDRSFVERCVSNPGMSLSMIPSDSIVLPRPSSSLCVVLKSNAWAYHEIRWFVGKRTD